MHKTSVTVHNSTKTRNDNSRFDIEERRRKVSSLLAQSMTEIEIGQELGVNQSTISRDIKVLKELSQQFVSDLAKSDLTYYYKQCIDGIEEVRRKGWDLFKEGDLIVRDKILALKVIRECNETNFVSFKEGPSMMNVQILQQRLEQIED
jgi:DNA-binding transcriptional ArsR family regulator